MKRLKATLAAFALFAGTLTSCRYMHDQGYDDAPGHEMAPNHGEANANPQVVDSTAGGRTPAESTTQGQAGSTSPNNSGATQNNTAP